MLAFQSRKPSAPFGRLELPLSGLGQHQVMRRVLLPHGLRLPARLQPLQRVLANRLQHHEARLAIGTIDAQQQAIVDK
jgi:hypothetical protein